MPKFTKNDVLSTYKELVKVQKQKREIEERESYLKGMLKMAIPSNGSKFGIEHTVKTGKSVSWAKIGAEVRDTLVPKTKLDAFNQIVTAHTKETERHTFKEAK